MRNPELRLRAESLDDTKRAVFVMYFDENL